MAKNQLDKLYDAVLKFANSKGREYIVVEIKRRYSFYTRKPDTDRYNAYIDGYNWHEAGSIAEVITAFETEATSMPPPPPPPKEETDLPF